MIRSISEKLVSLKQRFAGTGELLCDPDKRDAFQCPLVFKETVGQGFDKLADLVRNK